MNSEIEEVDARFVAAGPKVVWQRFEDELVIINLESCTYYSLNGSGARIWSLMEAGWTPSESAGRLAVNGAPADARATVIEFFGKLASEGLIKRGGVETERREVAEETPGRWEAPTIAGYTDMQDLLALDPIHEVDEAGWPARPEETR